MRHPLLVSIIEVGRGPVRRPADFLKTVFNNPGMRIRTPYFAPSWPPQRLKPARRVFDATPMRIALAVEGTRGDVHPMLALGDRLRARGHEIVVCAPPDFVEDAQAHGFTFHPVGRAARETLQEQAEAVVKGGLRMLRAANGYVEAALRAQFAVLPDATSGARLIIGAGLQMAGASVAERHGSAYRYVAYVPTLLPSAEHAPFLLPLPKLPRWGNRLAWWLLVRSYDAMLRASFARERAALGLAPVRSVLAHFITDHPLLAADPELAPVPADLRERTTVIGCLHPVDGPDLPRKLESFLESGPPPVYLGFGSMTDSDAAGTTALLLRAVELAGCRALLSEGWAGLATRGQAELHRRRDAGEAAGRRRNGGGRAGRRHGGPESHQDHALARFDLRPRSAGHHRRQAVALPSRHLQGPAGPGAGQCGADVHAALTAARFLLPATRFLQKKRKAGLRRPFV